MVKTNDGIGYTVWQFVLLYGSGLMTKYWSSALLHWVYLTNQSCNSTILCPLLKAWYGFKPLVVSLLMATPNQKLVEKKQNQTTCHKTNVILSTFQKHCEKCWTFEQIPTMNFAFLFVECVPLAMESSSMQKVKTSWFFSLYHLLVCPTYADFPMMDVVTWHIFWETNNKPWMSRILLTFHQHFTYISSIFQTKQI